MVSMRKTIRTPRSRQRRLQRDKDFTGDRLSTFRQVFLRHGLPGCMLSAACLVVPGLQSAFFEGLERGLANPQRYAVLFVLLLAGLTAYTRLVSERWRVSNVGWVIYLGALSFWEEWLFRLAIPEILERAGASIWLAAALSAAMFGGAHYFTLRWKSLWCCGAFLGGLLLSRQMYLHDDLLLVAALHWVVTLVNTPQPPGQTATG